MASQLQLPDDTNELAYGYEFADEDTDATYAYFTQVHDGIAFYNSQVNLVMKQNWIVALGLTFINAGLLLPSLRGLDMGLI